MFKTVTGDGENESDEKYMPASPKKIASLLGLSSRQQRASGDATLNELVPLLYKVVRKWAFNVVIVYKVIPRA